MTATRLYNPTYICAKGSISLRTDGRAAISRRLIYK
jgi:hypothetical protein